MPFSSPEASNQTFAQIKKVATTYVNFLKRKGKLQYVNTQQDYDGTFNRLIATAANLLHKGTATSIEQAVKMAIKDAETHNTSMQQPQPDTNKDPMQFAKSDGSIDYDAYNATMPSASTGSHFESYCESTYQKWMNYFSTGSK